ncbi:MAG TPA: hypothetical protein DCM28_10855 [Phycisphaerales bacterium]|nr:hypothetical protein [Phycisphaerales bacterium]HCD35240.1 hypothetical protein [Phycisphaerales bacterium]|tara:strand:- start:2201 stop:2440 length:240 start_codon:yes stop_codon:yes gene_type:complete
MTNILKKRRNPSVLLQFFTSREVVVVMLLMVIALLTWALSNDRGILVPYRDSAQKQIMQTPMYDHNDLDHETITLEDMQ